MTTSHPHTHVARRDLSALTAGIPYVIGFPPTDSLLLFTFNRGSTPAPSTTIRADLPAQQDVQPVADHLVAAAMLNQAVAVLAVVVGGTAEQHRPLVDALVEGFEDRDIPLLHASWAPTVNHGERWQCYLDPQCAGVIPDPQTSTWAVAMAIAGDLVYYDREEIAAHLAPDPPESLTRKEELLDEHLRNPQNPYTEGDLASDLALLSEVLADAESSSELPDLNEKQIVGLARALFHTPVKDECMAAALSSDPEAAERVWTVLVRALPAPERAEPAVLLAMSAYLRGSGVLAAMAVKTALEANPAHALATLLRHALQKGIPPYHLRTLLMKSILRNKGLPDNPVDDDPPWETTTPTPVPAPPPAPAPEPSSEREPGSGTLNARTAATLGLLTAERPRSANPLTALLPPTLPQRFMSPQVLPSPRSPWRPSDMPD
jgi:hypothetical protein